MIVISLPDGSVKNFDTPVSGVDIASDIGPGLSKAALAIKINGEVKDLSTVITESAKITIITARDEEALELLRHDAAHIMAQAVQELWPGTQITIGPAIENGFYYDFARDDSFTPEDLEKIEARMTDIVKRDLPITCEIWEHAKAIEVFTSIGELYKVEIIKEIISKGEQISVYRQGEWFDICRGPHLPSTGKLGNAFKLMKLAGAYWRGDSKNKMLQRIYGTAWADKKQLNAYLHMLEEAERRDHRHLGREMNLFHFQEEAPGAVFWHASGWILFRLLIDYMRQRQEENEYEEINTPSVMDRRLWERSGHWDTFRENMFSTQTEDMRIFALKPMNCPGCLQVFKQGIKSYRDLPLRIAEFGKVNRYEPSGALHGLMRVREFTQDDAHIFCTMEEIEEECCTVVKLILNIYEDFGFKDVRIKFSDRPIPDKRIGSDEDWDQLENALRGALDHMGYDYSCNPGEGAFYGPKLEFVLRDAIGRDWQCGTLQIDMNMPRRLGAVFIDRDGKKKYPIMLHRALFGSLERFVGILIEHYAGHLPLWLAPLQVVVTPIINEVDDYAHTVWIQLRNAGIRTKLDLRSEKINYKIREHSYAKVPIMLIVGIREVENKTVAVRRLGGKKQEILVLQRAIDKLRKEATGPLGRYH